MLLLLAAAAQQLPPINVTVQSPPSWPVWETTLFSVGVGAAFGIGGNILMEWIKPIMAKRRERSLVVAQIGAELMENLSEWEGIGRILNKATTPSDIELAMLIAEMAASSVKTKRFEIYAEEFNDLVHMADAGNDISSVYESFGSFSVISKEAPDELRFDVIKNIFSAASKLAHEYVNRHKLEYKQTHTFFEKVYASITGGRKKG
jgi:hypothetical protein